MEIKIPMSQEISKEQKKAKKKDARKSIEGSLLTDLTAAVVKFAPF